MNSTNCNTFFLNGSGLPHIFEADNENLRKGKDHGKDHPYLDQLDVGSARQ